MSPVVTFETPENITVSYPLAGPGTRFIAFVFDVFIIVVSLTILALLVTIVGLIVGPAASGDTMGLTGSILASIVTIVVGFIFLAYFGICEWFMNGVTPGKAAMRIRVVMADGFSLTFTGVLLRNIFRLVDVLPILWVVPVVTRREQRFGDMAGGTIVVSESAAPANSIRAQLAARPVSDARFTFSADQVAALTEVDLHAMELFLERRDRLGQTHRIQLAERLVAALVPRLGVVEDIFPADRESFVEDLLAAYARKESRDAA